MHDENDNSVIRVASAMIFNFILKRCSKRYSHAKVSYTSYLVVVCGRKTINLFQLYFLSNLAAGGE